MPRLSLSLDEVKEKLSITMLPSEQSIAVDLIKEIRALKKEKNAILLGHNYMTPDVFYGVSDFVGDSLALAKFSGNTDADIILFNGVHFMAETASIFNPEKKVLIADTEAGCSLAESISAHDLQQLKDKYPDTPVVSYVNCSAEIKALSDACCTSSNALEIVDSFEEEQIIFVPDAYLAKNVQKFTNKRIIFWEKGTCMVHELYTRQDIVTFRKQFDDVLIIAHPECHPEVLHESDFSGSTSQMSTFIREHERKNVMLVTECSMADNLRSEFPSKNFVSSCHTCPHMKRISLESIRAALIFEQYEVRVDESVRIPAKKALEYMINL